MKSYRVTCTRLDGSDSPVRKIQFVIDADSAEGAEDIADARLHRMRSFDRAEMSIDATVEVTV